MSLPELGEWLYRRPQCLVMFNVEIKGISYSPICPFLIRNNHLKSWHKSGLDSNWRLNFVSFIFCLFIYRLVEIRKALSF